MMSGKRGYITSKNLHHLTTSLLKTYKLETKKNTKLNCTLKKDIQITVTHDSIHRLIS